MTEVAHHYSQHKGVLLEHDPDDLWEIRASL